MASEDPLDGNRPLSNGELVDQLRATRAAIERIRNSMLVGRRWTWVVAVIGVCLAVLAFIAYRDSEDKSDQLHDQAMQIEELVRATFVQNCESTNDNLERINQGTLELSEIVGRFATDLGVEPEVV